MGAADLPLDGAQSASVAQSLPTDYLLWPPVRIDHCKQRRREEHAPEGDDESQHDRRQYRCPNGDSIAALHQVGLKYQSIDDSDDCVKDEDIQQMHERIRLAREEHC